MRKKIFVVVAAISLFAGSICADSGYINCENGSQHMAAWDSVESYVEVRDVLCNM